MNTPTPPTRVRLLLVALLMLGGAFAARGQLGSTPVELLNRYGPPTGIDTNEPGVQTLSYRKDNFDITAFGRDGVALRVVYRKKDFSEQDTQRLLELNRGNASWAPWEPPGTFDPGPSSSSWIRSDDMAMAARKGDEFTVTAAEWSRLPPPGEKSSSPLSAAVSNAPVISAPPPPLPAITQRPPRPGKPARRPHPGDSRTAACEILGPPLGGIVSGSREILQYPWGQLYLEHGKVVTID